MDSDSGKIPKSQLGHTSDCYFMRCPKCGAPPKHWCNMAGDTPRCAERDRLEVPFLVKKMRLAIDD